MEEVDSSSMHTIHYEGVMMCKKIYKCLIKVGAVGTKVPDCNLAQRIPVLLSSDFALYFEDCLMEKCCTWDNG